MAAKKPGAAGASFNPQTAAQTLAGLPPHILRIYNEYLEMPGLRLTREQAERLWGLEPATCIHALDQLVALRFLYCTPGGQYARLTEGAFSFKPGRMAKAKLNANPAARLRA